MKGLFGWRPGRQMQHILVPCVQNRTPGMHAWSSQPFPVSNQTGPKAVPLFKENFIFLVNITACKSSILCFWNLFPFWSHVLTLLETLIADASFLDHWSFDQFQDLVNRSFDDIKLRQLLLQDKLVIFLHLLGCDTNGHAHRPYSSIYLNNVKVVDQIAESVYNLMENYFNDNQTAYVFTADHGMSDKGNYTSNGFTNIFFAAHVYTVF